MRLANLTIPVKLSAVFACLLGVTLLVGVAAQTAFTDQARSVERSEAAARALQATETARYGLARQENSLRGFLLSGDPWYLQRIETLHRPTFDRAVAELASLSGDPAAAAAARDITGAYAGFRRRFIDSAPALARDPAARQAAAAAVGPAGAADAAIAPVEAALDRAVAAFRARQVAEDGARARAGARLATTLACGGVLLIMLTIMGALWLSRAIAAPIVELSRALDAIRRGAPPPAPLENDGEDEVARLGRAFSEVVTELRWHESSLLAAMENLTEARDAAQASDRLKTQFLANISHEILTPLNGVLGMVQAMEMDELADRQKDRLALVGASARTLHGLVEDLLELSRIEAGEVELDVAPFDLETLLNSAVEPWRGEAEAKALALQVRIEEGSGGNWTGDAARIARLLGNLVSNAVKFTDFGRVCVRAEPSGVGLRLIVRDTGVGIPAERQAELFSHFTQLDGSATRTVGGTGLGLSLCRAIVYRMGGDISVESAPGEGSTFTVDLPLTRQSRRRAA